MTIKQDIERYYNFWFTTDKIYDTWAKKQGISINELFVLFVIAENPDTCTQQRICQKLLLPKQTVNSILLKFEKEGYVKKQPSRQDRRSKILTFTEEGQRYADGILLRLYDIEGTALYNMNPEVRTALLEGFDAFLEVLRQAFEDAES